MANIYTRLSELVGRTPLFEPVRLAKQAGVSARILLKLEAFNPAGSAKDRIAVSILEAAEKSGALKPGGTVIEPTSGNTGIGLCAMAVPRGYRVIITMPETMSVERQKLMRAYGAELVLTPGQEGMAGAIRRAEALHAATENSVIAGQFENPANPRAHYETTGPEIWRDTDGRVDIFVAGVGTGGTLSGAGRYLKEQNPAVRVVAVEPAASPVLSEGRGGAHGIQGIGAGFVPKALDTSVYDEVLAVSDADALQTARAVTRSDGVFVGISSGAALYAALRLAERAENAGKTIVAVMPDGGDRYLSTPLVED